ncbi:MAG: amidohydrolase family protein [Burkholderiaceae bacterium]|nr:amidohydrolase family protein [Burkholderiaceae bacterium]
MTSMLALGLDLHTVISMVTVNAAQMCGMQDQIGVLSPGRVADVTVLNDDRGRWALRDNDGNQAIADRWLSPRFCLRAGERFDSHQQLLPQPQAA